ncbi:MAG: tetraacyldisaccharide 4'-kinase [Comamonadaceae bacterium CG12_big_fil_rev_8_21_14_0_65_59_15]|nr:MAG: tetraacyldisaccharide 4'-kinase [Comamonadaceae bacterium CG12_big_fil_rev_8_21_14_0_65_59_15]
MKPAPEPSLWQRTLMQHWLRRDWAAWLLWPLSLLYRVAFGVRQTLYRWHWLASMRLPVSVVVVGNVVAGGAGKTPVVLALVEHLQQRGVAVGVIARGYGRSSTGCEQVTLNRAAQEVGDEPALIQRRTGVPVFVAEQRVQAAQALLHAYPQTQVIVSDDGLQHLALARDLEIGVFDDRGVGNGWLLPAGPLREPWPRPLDLVLHTGNHPAFDGFQARRSLAPYAIDAQGTRVPLADLAAPGASPVLALAAIARPEAFFAMLRAQGVPLAQTLALPDHFDFSSFHRNDYGGYRLICTEKDAVKLWPLCPDALAVPLQCELPEAFWSAFDKRLETLLSSRPAQ